MRDGSETLSRIFIVRCARGFSFGCFLFQNFLPEQTADFLAKADSLLLRKIKQVKSLLSLRFLHNDRLKRGMS
jgi:hypothetical protein